MNQLIIVTSKKYEKYKSYLTLLKYFKKNNFSFEVIYAPSIDYKVNYRNFKLIISFGGDGTALRAMHLAWLNKLPVLNIGLGRVGYLVNNLNEKEYSNISNFAKLQYSFRKPLIQNSNNNQPAFNEIVINKISPTRLLDIEITTYEQNVNLRADGLIISTSLGSTAYNYSAGGPIIQPSLESIILTPIAPFSKFPRSIVLDNKTDVLINIKKDQHYSIQFDGEEVISSNSDDKSSYSYKLSNNKIKVLHTNNDPKLINFLNQILR
jgi:NAD+ kinase